MPEQEEGSDLNATLARVLHVLSRRRRWVVGTFCAVTLATIVGSFALPNRYTSSAALVVVQQQVPQRYVVPNSTTDLVSTLEAMKQEILSRNRLLKMIDDFDLYAARRHRLAPEKLLALMLRDIEIVPFGQRTQQNDYDAFKISFTGDSPEVAQQVTSTLTSLFINENLRMKEQQATNTTNFLHEQLDVKRRGLDQQEQRLREFKMQHIGELPEQQAGNLGILTGLQNQLQNTMANLNRAQQQRAYLQSLIGAYGRPAGARGGGALAGGGAPHATPLEVAQTELSRLEAVKAGLLAKYTPEHPDVLKAQREVEDAEQMVRRIQHSTSPGGRDAGAGNGGTAAPATPEAIEEANTVAQLRSQVEANRVELENLVKDEKQLKTSIADYENRINQTPLREQQQAGIIRDTEALRLEYSELQKKEQESQLATNLEKQQGGEQFRLIDAASMPTIPSSPKRLKLSLMGAVEGLVFGFGLAIFLEMRDTCFHTEQQLAGRFNPVPFVMGIPEVPTPMETHQEQLRAAMGWAADAFLVLLVCVAELYVYKSG